MQTRQGRGGKNSGAHGKLAEQASGLGDGLVTTERRRRSRPAELEDDGGGGVPGYLAWRDSVERARASRRSLWAAQGDEGEAMAAVVQVSGGRRVR